MVELVQRLAAYTTLGRPLLCLSLASKRIISCDILFSIANSSKSQPFWGNVVASNGAGPVPIPHKSLSSQSLADAIRFCLMPQTQQSARVVADQMRREHGVDMAVQSFHRHVNTSNMTCDVLPERAADWICRLPNSKSDMKLSHAALKTLVADRQMKLAKAIP